MGTLSAIHRMHQVAENAAPYLLSASLLITHHTRFMRNVLEDTHNEPERDSQFLCVTLDSYPA
jgi:hypothetical protein